MKSVNKKLSVLFITLLIALTFSTLTAWATPAVKSTKYNGYGIVTVTFKSSVRYKDSQVKVTDSSGSVHESRLLVRTNNVATFIFKDYKEGVKYSYKISGLRKRSESTYSAVYGSFTVPKISTTVKIESVEYDSEESAVEFDFDARIIFTDLKVSIKDSSNKEYVTGISPFSFGNDELEVKVSKLTRGTTYSYTIKGVRKAALKAEVQTLTGKFVA